MDVNEREHLTHVFLGGEGDEDDTLPKCNGVTLPLPWLFLFEVLSKVFVKFT